MNRGLIARRPYISQGVRVHLKLKKSNAKILVVDDFQPWHQFAIETFAHEKNLTIVAFASDGREAVEKAARWQPGIILMDVSLPLMSGFEATTRIRVVSPHSRILFVSEHRGSDLIQMAFDVGGSGYVLKSDSNTDLLRGVRAVLSGQQFVSRSLSGWRLDLSPTD
jgi:DNA-binding NarL/FixJ family response regulator